MADYPLRNEESLLQTLRRDHDRMVEEGAIPPGEPEILYGPVTPAAVYTSHPECDAEGCDDCVDGMVVTEDLSQMLQAVGWRRQVDQDS